MPTLETNVDPCAHGRENPPRAFRAPQCAFLQHRRRASAVPNALPAPLPAPN